MVYVGVHWANNETQHHRKLGCGAASTWPAHMGCLFGHTCLCRAPFHRPLQDNSEGSRGGLGCSETAALAKAVVYKLLGNPRKSGGERGCGLRRGGGGGEEADFPLEPPAMIDVATHTHTHTQHRLRLGGQRVALNTLLLPFPPSRHRTPPVTHLNALPLLLAVCGALEHRSGEMRARWRTSRHTTQNGFLCVAHAMMRKGYYSNVRCVCHCYTAGTPHWLDRGRKRAFPRSLCPPPRRR